MFTEKIGKRNKIHLRHLIIFKLPRQIPLHAFLPSHRQHEFPPGLPTESLQPKASPKECAGSVEMIRTSLKGRVECTEECPIWMEKTKMLKIFEAPHQLKGLKKSEKELISIGIVYPWCLKIPGPPMHFWGVGLLALLAKMKLLWKSYYIYLATTQEHPSFSLKRNRFPPTSWKLDFFSSIHQFLRQGLATFWDLSVLKK